LLVVLIIMYRCCSNVIVGRYDHWQYHCCLHTVARYCCSILLLDTVARYCCSMLLLNTVAQNCCSELLLKSVAQYCRSILLAFVNIIKSFITSRWSILLLVNGSFAVSADHLLSPIFFQCYHPLRTAGMTDCVCASRAAPPDIPSRQA
jgi:hypothetical protein